MALYVSICLLAELTAMSDTVNSGHVVILAIVWGTTIGLAVAHFFAFRLSARFVSGGTVNRSDGRLGLAQIAGSAGVAVLVTIPVVLLPTTSELDVARICLAAFIGIIGYGVARSSDASVPRSLAFSALILVAGLAIAILKNTLVGH